MRDATMVPGVRSTDEYREVDRLIRWGLNDCQIARLTRIPRGTIRDWRHRDGRPPGVFQDRSPRECFVCSPVPFDQAAYAYLLGLYLGDGCLSEHRRGVFALRVTLDNKYPKIIEECRRAIMDVRPGAAVFQVRAPGCTQVVSSWKHWPCLFPQHAPGRKHLRPVALESWQERVAFAHAERLIRGLIHSDGCRSRNVVKGKNYPRYQFTNYSTDIRASFAGSVITSGFPGVA
ncbi:MAG: hypothetical protein ABR518_00820 [Actinomycetota bacterium]